MTIVDARIGRTSGARANQGLDSFFFRVGCSISSNKSIEMTKRLIPDYNHGTLCTLTSVVLFFTVNDIWNMQSKGLASSGRWGAWEREQDVICVYVAHYSLRSSFRCSYSYSTNQQERQQQNSNNKSERAERKKDVVLLLMMMAPSRRIKILTFQNIKGHRSRIINADDQSSMHHIKLNTRW